jgi:Zn-dependent protease with chaperone function/Zn-finger nucleic acid-binding protein
MAERNLCQDFYDIQHQQWKKSIFLLFILLVFYFLAIGIIIMAILLSLGLFFPATYILSGTLLFKLLLGNLILSFLIAFLHLYDAQKFGAQCILKRLQAQPPDLTDRYHVQFANIVDEIRIASGLPQVKPCIIPQLAVNSMAIVEPDKTPSVIITEGLLADCTRDELQAVVAHELAHIARGDAFYVTLVCSLANFFERLKEAFEPEDDQESRLDQQQREGIAAPILVYLAVTASAIVMTLLSALISRQREILADAAAVEISRDPVSLARAIYKAHLKNSFVGDFAVTYSPLFIVSTQLKNESEGFFSNIFSTHPPLMKRIGFLASMAKKSSAKIIEEVWESQRNRERARIELLSLEELKHKGIVAAPEPGITVQPDEKIWLIRDSKGNWEGPFTLEELLTLPYFTSMLHVKNSHEGIEALAREFPQIRIGLHNLARKKSIDPAKQGRCPHCHIPLLDTFYEGVPIKLCSSCQGKLVDLASIGRIFARQEVGFSEDLKRKVQEFKRQFLENPVKTQKINSQASSQEARSFFCPNCGYKLAPRPFNYYYIVPVDKCLSCYKIWFDADELEILQILVEEHI